MKKAFDQNVSRSKPRLRLGTGPGDGAEASSIEEPSTVSSSEEVAEIKARIERARTAEAELTATVHAPAEAEAKKVAPPQSPAARAQAAEVKAKNGAGKRNGTELTAEARRERLKERLRAARENPRPEPLPATVAEAGALAVERISTLQTEVAKLKALNLTLTQDLESSRRQSEKATEEARIRMDEARRLSAEMEARSKLLGELERELASLEGERNEALLALQEARQTIEETGHEKETLHEEIVNRDKALSESLAEEERLAAELEAARDHAENLRRSLDALNTERDVLARQVADLTTERAELLEARKALESVHRALSQAARR